MLGWDEPFLQRAAVWLLDRADNKSGQADLGDLICVLPGSRARRVLVGMLVDLAQERDCALAPPMTLTPGELPAALLGPPGELASDMVRRFAWIEALKGLAPDVIAPLFPHALDEDDLPGCSRLAGALERAADDLAGQGLRMNNVAGHAGDALPPEEVSRWRALGEAQDRAELLLRDRGLVEDVIAMSAKTLDPKAPVLARIHRVVLIGVPEMNRVERAAIVRGASSIDALIFAPESMRDHFDELGCVDVPVWASAAVELDEARVVFADDQHDQAERALVCLAQRSEEVDVGEVVVGVADPAALPGLRRRAELTSGVTLRAGVGERASSTPPGRLLSLVGAYLRDGTLDAMTALARHPDVESALLKRSLEVNSDGNSSTEWWLDRLDAIRRDHVLMDPRAEPTVMRDSDAKALRFVRNNLSELLGDLARAPSAARPLGSWVEAMETALTSIYEDRALRPDDETDRRTIAGLKAVQSALAGLAEESAGAAISSPVATAPQMIALLEEQLEGKSNPEPMTPGAIETLGWLELALDPAPMCVVIGLTEANVPGSVTHDPLLPGSLREQLGMTTNEARLARDAYLLAAINASRNAVFITSRLGAQGDPQIPSRLLFRCAGPTLAQRVRRFVHVEPGQATNMRLASRLRAGEVDRFSPALVVGADYEPPTSMRITDFDAYLKSPMGWYLERHLGLKDDDEAPRELSPGQYGSLVHKAFELFGRDESTRDLDDPDAVERALCDLLDVAAKQQLGAKPPTAATIQLELVRNSMKYFAHKQAMRRQAGWRIAHVEWSPDQGDARAAIDVDGEPMMLRGKIDRIDVHDDGRWAIIDYKTGKNADNVEKAHRKHTGEWTSVQLPLYRNLVELLGPPDDVELAYAQLPGSEHADVWSIAKWTADDLSAAIEVAKGVVRSIRAHRPGDVIEPGKNPPERGAFGFLTGMRFDLGGRAGAGDAEMEETP